MSFFYAVEKRDSLLFKSSDERMCLLIVCLEAESDPWERRTRRVPFPFSDFAKNVVILLSIATQPLFDAGEERMYKSLPREHQRFVELGPSARYRP